jgi:internalin A
VRRVLRAMSQEVTECPRLFVLVPDRRRMRRPWEERYSITLWCEHADEEHPWPDATYAVAQRKEWLVELAPYAALVIRTLKLAAPIVGSAAAAFIPELQGEQARAQLELMKAVVADLPDVAPVVDEELGGTGRDLTRAEGAGLRALRYFLLQTDPPRRFGGLTPRQTPSGDQVWICPRHYAAYDPGLPALTPDSAKPRRKA